MGRVLWREPVSKWRPGYAGHSLWFYGFSFGKVAVGWLRMVPGGVKRLPNGRFVPDCNLDEIARKTSQSAQGSADKCCPYCAGDSEKPCICPKDKLGYALGTEESTNRKVAP